MTSTSEVSICNMALSRLGEDETIVSLTGDSRLIRLCRRFYDQTRDELIRHYRWKFAISRASVGSDATNPAFTWSYRYGLPVDCLRVLAVNEYDAGEWENVEGINPKWDREGEYIVTDELTPINVRFIKRIEDASVFPPEFVEALAAKLAVKFGPSLRDTGNNDDLDKDFEMAIMRARRTNAIEGRPYFQQQSYSDWMHGG